MGKNLMYIFVSLISLVIIITGFVIISSPYEGIKEERLEEKNESDDSLSFGIMLSTEKRYYKPGDNFLLNIINNRNSSIYDAGGPYPPSLNTFFDYSMQIYVNGSWESFPLVRYTGNDFEKMLKKSILYPCVFIILENTVQIAIIQKRLH